MTNKVAVDDLFASIDYLNQVSLESHAMIIKLRKASEDLELAKVAFAKAHGFNGTPLLVRVPDSNKVVRISRSDFGYDGINVSVEELV